MLITAIAAVVDEAKLLRKSPSTETIEDFGYFKKLFRSTQTQLLIPDQAYDEYQLSYTKIYVELEETLNITTGQVKKIGAPKH